MAKKKKSKDAENSNSFHYSVELTGIILILIGIVGFGFGPVGGFIKKFAMFLVGEWWPAILILILWLGLYMVIKRKLPKFFTSRLVGFYIILLVILVLSHYTFIKECQTPKEIFSQTLNNFADRTGSMGSVGGIVSAGISNNAIGGGIIGASFAFVFASLFGITGTTIVMSILILFGVIMLFDITISDIYNKIKSYFVSLKEKRQAKKQSLKENNNENDDEINNKIVIASVEELKTNQKEIEEIPAVSEESSFSNNSNNYQLPPLSLLEDPKKSGQNYSTEFIKNTKVALEKVLADFGIKGNVTEIHPGPTVTQFEVAIPSGTKVKTISGIHNEIKLALAAKEIRIQAPIPGKSTVGIEIPNPTISEVRIKEILSNIPKNQENANILVSLGKDIMGRVQTADISKMPHLLVAGSTGSGKSVCINSFIISILMRKKPDELKLVLVDPKKVELSNYNGVPHLLCPVVTDPKKASLTLQKIVSEMERRYDLFSEVGAKNITSYNAIIEKQIKKGNTSEKLLPYMVVIIDELADLMLIAAKEVEDSIMRITQMARAAGIHLIVATQRPSTDVITGVVKANIPSRISFAVSSGIDSRTILDATGAEKLLGKGDMLYLPMGENASQRIQGAYITDEEIKRVIDYVCKEQIAKYDESITNPVIEYSNQKSEKEEYDDPLYNEIVEFAVNQGKLSASLVQRRFRLGYNRAARIIDLLEERGIIGPQNGSKPREVLVKLENNDEE